MNGRMAPKGITTHSKVAPGDDRRPDGLIRVRNAPRRFSACVVIGLLLGIAGRAYAGEPPSFKRAMAFTLHQWVSQEGEWRQPKVAFLNNTWQAVMDGNFANTANWTLGIVPVANHVAIFDGTSSVSVTSGLDRSANPFEQLLVKPGYGGNMGSQGNPLLVDVGSGVIVWRGRGRGFISPKLGSTTNVIVDTPHVLSGSRYNLVIGGAGAGTAGSVAQIGIKRGNANLAGDMRSTGQIYLLGDAARFVMDAELIGLIGPQHIICAAGILVTYRTQEADAFLIVGDRSRVTQIGPLANTNHVVVIGNGRFEYLPTSAPGTTPLLSAIGGVYDQSDEKWDSVWGTTIIGPDAMIIGGAVRGTNVFPASLNFGDDYPGTKE